MELKMPYYARMTMYLIGLFALFTLLYITKHIVVPLAFASLVSIVLSPIVDYFVRHGIRRILAIVLSLCIAFLFLTGLGTLIISQLSHLGDSWPALVDKFTIVLNQSISSISDYIDVNPENIHEWIAKNKGELLNINGTVVGQTIVSVGSAIAAFILIPVYVFLLIYYQPILLEFIYKVSGAKNQVQVGKIVAQTKTIVQQYLIGLLIETVLVAVLNTSALLLLGIDYAILIGVIGALFNLIPYIGGIVSVSLPMAIALATKSPIFALYVFAAYYLIQLVDNHYFVPIIVASKVKINALFSILVVLVGNALWGIPGMFLSIPFLAIVKVVFDNIESLKPWGFLLGDSMPLTFKKPTFLKKKMKRTQNEPL